MEKLKADLRLDHSICLELSEHTKYFDAQLHPSEALPPQT
jgi:hypothetical protein